MEKFLKRKIPPGDQNKDDSAAKEPQPQFKKFCNREANATVCGGPWHGTVWKPLSYNIKFKSERGDVITARVHKDVDNLFFPPSMSKILLI